MEIAITSSDDYVPISFKSADVFHESIYSDEEGPLSQSSPEVFHSTFFVHRIKPIVNFGIPTLHFNELEVHRDLSSGHCGRSSGHYDRLIACYMNPLVDYAIRTVHFHKTDAHFAIPTLHRDISNVDRMNSDINRQKWLASFLE